MDALQAAGKKAEDGFNEVLGSIGSIFGGPQRTIGRSMSLDSSDIGAYAFAPPPVQQKKVVVPRPNVAPPPWPGPDGDTVMRLHCAGLERLVMMGLSPQAARVSLRHLDAWMVSEAGVKEMRAAEEVAEATGEPLLHLGAHIKLGGLVKNPAANGKVGTLYAYRAEDQRWKVVLAEGRTYWLQPKFIRLLEEKKIEKAGDVAPDEPLPSESAPELAVAYAKLEAGQKALKEKHEAQQIQLLERQEFLHQYQEQLDAQSQGLIERRKTIAMDQAKGFQALDQATTGPAEPSATPRKQAFVIREDSNLAVQEDEDEDEGDGADSPPELDEVWDTDWAAVAALSGGTPTGASCSTTASPTSDPNVSPPEEPQRAAARLVQVPVANPLDQELLQRKLQEKQDQAEQQNRGDNASDACPLPERPAEKLEEKRRDVEVDETTKADDGI